MWNQGFPVNWSAPLNRGLLSWWLRPPVQVSNARFLDFAGRNHGALVGAPVWSGNTRPGGWGSLFLDAIDEYVNLSNPATLALLTDLTIAGWIKPSDISQPNNYLISAYNSDANAAYGLKTDASVLRAFIAHADVLYWATSRIRHTNMIPRIT